MERRKFIIGAGALATGTSAAIGTGAFDAAQADRNVDVAVASDSSAYLGLSAENSAFASEAPDGSLSINLDGDNATSKGGQGVNPDGVTLIEDVFSITNQGTQAYEITGEATGDHTDAVVFGVQNFAGNVQNDATWSLTGGSVDAAILDAGAGNESQDPSEGSVVSPGETVWVQMFIDTRPDDIQADDTLINSLTIFADDSDGY